MDSDDIIEFELWDASGKSVAYFGDLKKLSDSFHSKVTENFKEGGLRNIYRKNESGSIRLIVKDNSPFFKGTRGINRGCAIFFSLIPKFRLVENSHRQHFDSIIRRFAHNLIKFQTRFKANFSTLISDTARSRPFSEFQEEVKRRIESNTSIAARDVCQMSHRAVDLDAQIETLRIISGYADTPSPDNKIKVDLLRTIYRLTNPFREELEKRGIKIHILIPPANSGDEKILVDSGLFNAAIWQLLDNASKYVKDGTQIDVTADLSSNPQKLEFLMISVCIDKDEEELIFLEGKKGRHAGQKGENGIGLFIVKKALGLMNSKIYVTNDGYVDEYKGYKYCKNRFILEFKR